MKTEDEILEKLYDLKQATELAISIVKSKLLREAKPEEFSESTDPDGFAIGNWLVRPRTSLGCQVHDVPTSDHRVTHKTTEPAGPEELEEKGGS